MIATKHGGRLALALMVLALAGCDDTSGVYGDLALEVTGGAALTAPFVRVIR